MLTGIHFNYYLICPRKLWLFSRGINMEHTSELVHEGRLIHDNSYMFRSWRFKEIEIEGIKIDYYDYKKRIIHEIKKSDSYEESHILQMKYYIYVLQNKGIKGVTGIIEYPKLRKIETVNLSEEDIVIINKIINDIKNIIFSKSCPNRLNQKKCKNCSYHDFCWSGEIEER